MSRTEFGPIRQVAYLVEDLSASIARWGRFAGVGPWTVYRNVVLTGQCRGRDTAVRMDVGLSYQDGLQIELIQPLSRTPSPYQDGEGRTLIGMHHIAWHSADLTRDKALAAERGLTLAFAAGNGAANVAYFESAEEPGLLFEFIETSPMLLQGFEAGAAASRDWDGQALILQEFDFGG